MKSTLFLFAFSVLLFTACTKETQPYVVFKNSEYKELKQHSVDVQVGDHYYLIVENGYKAGTPNISIQKNNNPEQDISDSSVVKIETHGWNGQQQLTFNVLRVHLDFNANEYNSGDQLTLFSRHGSVGESVVFNIQ